MKKTWKFIASTLVVSMLCMCFGLCEAEAGLSRVVVDSASYTEELNTAVWNIPEKDVTVQDGALYFSAESSKYTRLITKSMVQKSEGSSELVSAGFDLNLKSMPENGEFIVGFGLPTIESFSGEQGQIEVAFVNTNGIQVAVRYFENAGEAQNIIEPKTSGIRIGNQANVAITIGNDKTLTVAVNSRNVASAVLPVDAEGSVGFFQTGKCEAIVSDLVISSSRYDRPENSNFTENFDGDSYNANVLFSKGSPSAYVPSVMSVESYEDNDVMLYENSGPAQIGTRQKYSNFELTFDVPYLLRKNIEDENGKVQYEKSMWIGVSIGDDNIECENADYTYAADMIYFDTDSNVKSFASGHAVVASSEKYKFFAEDETRGFSIQVKVVDAHITIGMKWLDEEKFTVIGEYDTADKLTPLGYVHIWTCGPGNFAIDNIKMTNLDENPNLVDVEYKTSKFEVPEDFEYVEREMIYRPDTERTGDSFNVYLIIPCAAVVMLLMIGASVIITKRRAKENE